MVNKKIFIKEEDNKIYVYIQGYGSNEVFIESQMSWWIAFWDLHYGENIEVYIKDYKNLIKLYIPFSTNKEIVIQKEVSNLNDWKELKTGVRNIFE